MVPPYACQRLAALVLVVLCSSCSKGKDWKKCYPVEGRVFFNKAPATGTRVIFVPLADPAGPRPQARVESDGSFKLSTYLAGDGAPAGSYTVIAYLKKHNEEDEEEGPNLLPARYLNPSTSGLRAEIKERKNVLDPFYLTP